MKRINCWNSLPSNWVWCKIIWNEVLDLERKELSVEDIKRISREIQWFHWVSGKITNIIDKVRIRAKTWAEVKWICSTWILFFDHTTWKYKIIEKNEWKLWLTTMPNCENSFENDLWDLNGFDYIDMGFYTYFFYPSEWDLLLKLLNGEKLTPNDRNTDITNQWLSARTKYKVNGALQAAA